MSVINAHKNAYTRESRPRIYALEYQHTFDILEYANRVSYRVAEKNEYIHTYTRKHTQLHMEEKRTKRKYGI